MLFNSLNFVFFFFVVYFSYLTLKWRAQNVLLFVASYVFYGWWDWRFLGLIFITTLTDFLIGQGLARSQEKRRRRGLLMTSMCVDLGILFFFKYFNFFADSMVRLCEALGFSPDPVTLNIVLPVGVSFYTFQSMSYTIDVYRGEIHPTKSFLNYALYVSFFPQLVAGPIERAKHLLPQVENERTITYPRVREGAWLILLGYFKKVVIADNMAAIANAVFNSPDNYHGFSVLLGVYAFAFQIYGDFSGYSDIARGVAKLMGFDIMLNFRMPYFATNPREFWHRWHISLSTWLRDYLYFSLGGNRKGVFNTYRNLFLTMLLGGLWHGAAWNFVFWGVYQGGILIIHRLYEGFSRKRKEAASSSFVVRLLKILFMFQVICVGWILFRINSIGDFWIVIRNLCHPEFSHFTWVVEMVILLWPLLLLQVLKEASGDMLVVKQWARPFRFALYCVFFSYILLCGKVDGFEFIYFQF